MPVPADSPRSSRSRRGRARITGGSGGTAAGCATPSTTTTRTGSCRPAPAGGTITPPAAPGRAPAPPPRRYRPAPGPPRRTAGCPPPWGVRGPSAVPLLFVPLAGSAVQERKSPRGGEAEICPGVDLQEEPAARLVPAARAGQPQVMRQLRQVWALCAIHCSPVLLFNFNLHFIKITQL